MKHCTSNLINGAPRPMDMSYIQTKEGKSYLSFLSFSWGLAAEVDIESEQIRFLGGARFTIWSLYSLLKMDSSQAKISYKQIDIESNPKDRSKHRYLKKGYWCGVLGIDDDISEASDSNLVDLDSKSVFPLPTSVELASVQPSQLENILQEPPIDTSLSTSDGWNVIEDKFVMGMVLSKPWLAKDVYMAPQFKGLDDGVMWLIMIRHGISRDRMLQLMMSFSDGGHIQFPEVEMIPVTAVRLEPRVDSGVMMVDGEQIEHGPIQAEVLPSFSNIVC